MHPEEEASIELRFAPSSLQRFEVLRALKPGAPFRVELVRDRTDGAHYALLSCRAGDPACELLRDEFRRTSQLEPADLPIACDLGHDIASDRIFLLLAFGAGAEASLDELRASLDAAAESAPLEKTTSPASAGVAHLRALRSGFLEEQLLLAVGTDDASKARWLNEVWRVALLEGVATVRLTCNPDDPPFHSILEIVARADAAAGRAGASRGRPRSGPTDPGPTRPGLPSAGLLGLAGDSPGAGTTQATLRDLASRVLTVAETYPLALLVGDVDRADERTFEFLRHLIHRESRCGPLVIATSASEAPLGRILGRSERTTLVRIAGEPDAHRPQQAAVTEAAQPILEALAVLEGGAPAPIVAEVAQRPADFALRAAVGTGEVVAEFRRHGRWYRIADRTRAEALLADLDRNARAALHTRALRAWSTWPIAEDRPIVSMVRHAMRSKAPGEVVALAVPVAQRLVENGFLERAGALLPEVLAYLAPTRSEVLEGIELLLAETEIRAGRPERVSKLLGPRLARSASDDPELVAALRLVGSAAEACGNLDEARFFLERALASINDWVDLDERLRVRERLGAVYFRQGSFEEARRLWQEASASAADSPSSSVTANLLNDLGVLATRESDLAAARELHDHARQMRRDLGDLEGEARSLTNLGVLELELGNYQRAHDWLDRSLGLKRLIAGPQSIAVSLRNLGTLGGFLGDFRSSIAHLEESLELRTLTGDRIGEATTRRVLARSLVEIGEFSRAEVQLARSRALLVETDTLRAEEASLAIVEARMAFLRGSFEEADDRASRGLEAVPAADTPKLEAELLRLRGEVRLARGQLAESLADLEGALNVASAIDDRWGIGWAHVLLGQRALAAGAGDTAREHVQAAHDIVEAMGATPLAPEVELLRSAERAHAGDSDAAYGHLARAERLAREVGTLETLSRARTKLGDHAHLHGRVPRSTDDGVADVATVTTRRSLGAARVINQLRDPEELLVALRDRMHELLAVDQSDLILLGRDGSLQPMEKKSGFDSSDDGLVLTSVVRRSVDAGRPVVADERPTTVSVPLIAAGETIGALQLTRRRAPFSEDELARLELFAHHVALVVQNGRMAKRLELALEGQREYEARLVSGERLRALGEMSAGIAHDFNNLLAIVLGSADQLSQVALPEASRTSLARLREAAESAAETIRRLQTFSDHTVAHDLGAVDLTAAARAAIEMALGHTCARPTHLIEVDLDEELQVAAEASELTNVLFNLMLNALEAMPEGGTIRVRAFERGGHAIVEVEDSGPGVSAETRARIFEPFFSTKADGKGLGLSISWGLVRRAGGTIDLRPAEGGGAVFVVQLPLATDAGASAEGHGDGGVEAEALRVLIIEEDEILRDSMRLLLTEAGFAPDTTDTARAGIRRLEDEAFDLVLANHDGHDLDGLAIARESKRLQPDCMVLLMVDQHDGHATVEDETVDGVVEKPVTGEKLSAVVRSG